MEELQIKIETREPFVIENKEQRIFAVLHKPLESKTPPPVVCTFHGFASNKLGTNRSYVHLAEALSQAGIATLRFDFRGSGDSEGSFGDMTLEDMVSDAKCVFDFIRKLDGIDKKRIGVFGTSMGGAIAVLAQKGLVDIKTMALWAPVASGKLWYYDILAQNPDLKKMDPHKAFDSFRGLKISQAFREEFGKMNAASEIQHLNYPILHMHGENDVTLSLAHQDAYRSFAPPGSRFVTYPEAEHGLGYLKIFPEVVKESIDWFNKYL